MVKDSKVEVVGGVWLEEDILRGVKEGGMEVVVAWAGTRSNSSCDHVPHCDTT